MCVTAAAVAVIVFVVVELTTHFTTQHDPSVNGFRMLVESLTLRIRI